MTRRALLIGTNYPGSPYALAGCVRDVELVADALSARRFTPTLLTDADATRDRIIEAATRLVRDAKAGDALFVGFSGHGTHVRDLDGDEGDGRDEAICPTDFAGGRLLLDDDWRRIFAPLAPGVALTVFMDCCHSGTITRFAGGNLPVGARGTRRARYVRATTELEVKHARDRADAGRAPRVVTAEQMPGVLLSACLATEVAYESPGEDGRTGGDFTRAAVAVWREAGRTLTHAGFLRRVLAKFGPDRAQTPNLDGPPDALKRSLVTVPR